MLIGLVISGLAAGCSPSRKELMAELDEVKADLATSKDQAKSLSQRIKELEDELVSRQTEIDALQSKIDANEAELAELRAAKAEREKELETYKQLFARLKKLIDSGAIKVVFRKGKMMVEMASAVLFDSGKTKLKEDGLATLDELAQVLKTVGDREFLVAGHTDNIPIKTRKFKNNWELSTQRAVVVVDYMIEHGFPSGQLGAAGYGEVDPVASNDTEDGRAQNRRIEIILMPNLGELKGIREMLEGK